MKKIILFVFLTVFSLSLFAQRLNEHGLKMVSEIEYQKGHWPTKTRNYKFSYDDNNRLSRMTIYVDGKLFRDFVKTDGGLTITDHDSYNYSPLKWEVEFDCYGNISRIAEFEEFAPGSIKKDEFVYSYERNKTDDMFWLSKISSTETSKRKGQKSWYGTTVGTMYYKNYNNDGFISSDDGSDLGKQYNIDYGHVNDTNMNLFYFFGMIRCMNICGLTEWLPCRSKYFIDENTEWRKDLGITYEYHYDDKGNLISFEHICPKFKYSEWSVKIKYVY